jgi:hypothetical protein
MGWHKENTSKGKFIIILWHYSTVYNSETKSSETNRFQFVTEQNYICSDVIKRHNLRHLDNMPYKSKGKKQKLHQSKLHKIFITHNLFVSQSAFCYPENYMAITYVFYAVGSSVLDNLPPEE